jgi:hypothetical protein
MGRPVEDYKIVKNERLIRIVFGGGKGKITLKYTVQRRTEDRAMICEITSADNFGRFAHPAIFTG